MGKPFIYVTSATDIFIAFSGAFGLLIDGEVVCDVLVRL